MTLLAPLSAAIAAAVALPVLLVLYMLKLRRKRLRVSSTMLWEQAAEDLHANEPFRRLRTPLLFFVQLLAIASLSLALGRPAVPGVGASSERVLLLIDASASMRAADGEAGATRFGEAVARARTILDGLPGSAAVQVGVFAADAETLTTMSTDHRRARRALAAIEPTDQPGRLLPAIELASALLGSKAEDEDRSAAATVILVSDGGFDDVPEPLEGGTLRLERVGPEAGTLADNAGIVAFSVRRDANDPAAVQAFLRIQNAAGSSRSVPLATLLDGTTVDRRAVTLPAADDTGPGSATETILLTPGDASLLEFRLETEDALASDDSARVILEREPPGEVLLVSPDGEDPVGWIVGDILEAIAGERLRRIGPAMLAQRLAESDGLRGVEAVVLDRVAPGAAVPRPTLSFGVPIGELPVVASRNGQTVDRDEIVNWSRSDPVTRGLALDAVRVAVPAWFDDAATPDARTLARGRLGPVIVHIQDGRHPRIGLAFEPAQSTWALRPSFPLFVAQAFEVLTGSRGASAGRSGTTASTIELELPGTSPMELRGPVEISGRALGEPVDGMVDVVFAPPERVGVYAAPAGQPRVAVNLLNGAESSLRVRERVSVGSVPVLAGSGGGSWREVWAWFVLAAGLLMVLEWLLYASKLGGR